MALACGALGSWLRLDFRSYLNLNASRPQPGMLMEQSPWGRPRIPDSRSPVSRLAGFQTGGKSPFPDSAENGKRGAGGGGPGIWGSAVGS
jgi:hypothetical protein